MTNLFYYTNVGLFLLFISTTAYSPVDDLDINSYLGRWYQVYQDKVDSFLKVDLLVSLPITI